MFLHVCVRCVPVSLHVRVYGVCPCLYMSVYGVCPCLYMSLYGVCPCLCICQCTVCAHVSACQCTVFTLCPVRCVPVSLHARCLWCVRLTALVLKTLCHAESITFIDHGNLIDNGFAWLLDQVRDNGTLHERDRRLAQVSRSQPV